ncbi:MAG: hypothetical protein KDD76_05960, partial [Rickettsiales bacterium]|nr:hypothetical protein [Rickettsiales bacterium]
KKYFETGEVGQDGNGTLITKYMDAAGTPENYAQYKKELDERRREGDITPEERGMDNVDDAYDAGLGNMLAGLAVVAMVGMAAASQSQNKSSAPDVSDVAGGLSGVRLSASGAGTPDISSPEEAVAGIHNATKASQELNPNINLDDFKPDKSSRNLS